MNSEKILDYWIWIDTVISDYSQKRPNTKMFCADPMRCIQVQLCKQCKHTLSKSDTFRHSTGKLKIDDDKMRRRLTVTPENITAKTYIFYDVYSNQIKLIIDGQLFR